jgi:hypothetical protein
MMNWLSLLDRRQSVSKRGEVHGRGINKQMRLIKWKKKSRRSILGGVVFLS